VVLIILESYKCYIDTLLKIKHTSSKNDCLCYLTKSHIYLVKFPYNQSINFTLFIKAQTPKMIKLDDCTRLAVPSPMPFHKMTLHCLLAFCLFEFVFLSSASAQQEQIFPNNSLKVTNPPAFPYGIDIDLNYTGTWTREYGISYDSTGKLFSFGVYGTNGTLNYGYIGGNTTNATAYQNTWMAFLPTGSVGINTTTPHTLLEAKSSVDMGNTGTQYVAPMHIGFTNDYGSGAAAQYILLIPAYAGTVGQASAGMSGRISIVRGGTTTYCAILEYDISAQSAYGETYINVVPKSNQSYPLNIYEVTYSGVPYLAINGADLIRSGGQLNYEGYFWNNYNGVQPQIVLASSCTNISEFQSYTNLAGSILTANADGYIGVGTTNPQSLFSVEGTITAQQLKITQQNWSDFVFDSSYKRMPLEEVSEYVHANRHLPDIPSEAALVKSGLDVGAMQRLHMQKIEELTLYAIEANKQIKTQDSINIQQQKTIAQQRQMLDRQQLMLEQLKAQLQNQQGELDKIKASVSSH
jgi:hypothetical protein